jgi:integrase
MARGNGIKRQKDGSWLVNIELGRDPDGKRRQHRKRFERKADAEAYRDQARADQRKGTFVLPAKATVRDFAAQWLEIGVRGNLADSTAIDYQETLDYYMLPRLGHVRLSDLRKPAVQAAFNDLAKEVSPTTVRHAHRVFRRMLNVAIEWNELAINPAVGVALPRAAKRQATIWTVDQAITFLKRAELAPDTAMWDLLLTTGARISEVVALTWPDVDFKNHTVRIAAAMSRSLHKKVDRNGPKTEGSERSLPLHRKTIAALKEQRKVQRAELLKTQIRPTIDYIFTSTPGIPLTRNAAYRRFKTLLASAGLPDIRLHDLRHTVASILLERGTPIPEVAQRLGHSSPLVTMGVYAHVLPDKQVEVTKRLGDLMYGDG